MAKVRIRIESKRTTDVFWRFHGKSIDEPLNNDWWKSQPEKNIGVARAPFVHEETVDLEPGRHYVEYAASGSVPEYAWHAKIYVNERLVGEGDVGRRTHLKVTFLVGLVLAWPIPSPLLPQRIYLRPVMLG